MGSLSIFLPFGHRHFFDSFSTKERTILTGVSKNQMTPNKSLQRNWLRLMAISMPILF